jgi:putative acyl-CoA dehydrogenase
LALALQASQLLRHAPSVVADAFVATRLAGDGGMHYGTLPSGTNVSAIIERHQPVAA